MNITFNPWGGSNCPNCGERLWTNMIHQCNPGTKEVKQPCKHEYFYMDGNVRRCASCLMGV